MPIAIQIIGSATHLYANPVWVKSYEDTPCGRGHLVVTDNPSEAKPFADLREAMAFYRQESKAVPLRLDGKPNRPLTAYTVEFSTAHQTA